MQEHEERRDGEQAVADDLVAPIHVVLGLVGIIAETADGLPDGEGQRTRARSVENVPQQVTAHQPTHRESEK